MAVTSALKATPNSGVTKSWDVTSGADTDTTGVITHGFTVGGVATAPAMVWLVPTQTRAYSKAWALGAVTTTTITINALSATGGGLAGTPQLQVIAMLPHSLLGSH